MKEMRGAKARKQRQEYTSQAPKLRRNNELPLGALLVSRHRSSTAAGWRGEGRMSLSVTGVALSRTPKPQKSVDCLAQVAGDPEAK